MILVLINGFSGAGKDTFVKLAAAKRPNTPTKNIHRSDIAKRMLCSVGWSGERTIEVRRLLADMTEFMENNGYLNEYLDYELKNSNPNTVIFYHIRDPKGITKIKEKYWFKTDLNIVSVLIDRKEVEAVEKDRWGIKDYDYDVVIDNNKDMEELEKATELFLVGLEVAYGK